MPYDFSITNEERLYLREIAKKYIEYAHLPVMEERKKLWYAHNSLKGDKPVIVMEMDSFEDDMLPPPVCQSPAAVEIEKNLIRWIVNHEMVDDDKVMPPFYSVDWKISCKTFGMDIKKRFAADNEGRTIGFTQEHPIKDLYKDFSLLKPSVYSVDREYTHAKKAFAEETIGDIMPVVIKNNSLRWYIALSSKVVDLMGLENMMYAMVDYPERFHELYEFLKCDILAYARWQQEEGLLTLNNGYDYVGAGSYGFTTELPTENYRLTGKVTLKDLWLNMNSQETVGISPEMYHEFIYPYYRDIAKEFGLLYYGCCEPVHNIWEKSISRLPGLRKVSVSPWCDEEYMGEALRASNVIYSRKPRPNFIGVGNFHEEEFEEHIKATLKPH